MSIESDVAKWKSNVSRILEIDSEGILLTETVKKYFDEVASVFKKGTFDAENTKKQLRALRARNTRLSGKPIAVELSSFINITERYATKTEDAFASFAKLLTLSSTSPRSHQVQSSRQNPSPDSLDFSELEELDRIFSELDGPANGSPSRTPPSRTQPNPSPRLNSLTAYGRQVQQRVVENPFADEVEKKSKVPWVIGIILLIIGAILVVNSNVVKGTMKDPRDGKTYKTVKIGSQIWMAENLNFRTKDSWCNDNKESNCSKYGRLYTWNAAIKACPSGWHLPSHVEFETLLTAVGGGSTAGKMLKSQSGWYDNGNGIDAYGFSALPAGDRNYYGVFSTPGRSADFWSATEFDFGIPYVLRQRYYKLSLGYFSEFPGLASSSEDFAYSVRCIKD